MVDFRRPGHIIIHCTLDTHMHVATLYTYIASYVGLILNKKIAFVTYVSYCTHTKYSTSSYMYPLPTYYICIYDKA